MGFGQIDLSGVSESEACAACHEKTEKKTMFTVLMNTTDPVKRLTCLIVALFAALFFVLSADAGVTGPCYNCHTMHNSQNGQPVNRGDSAWGETSVSADPIPTLLIASCLGCHSSTDNQTIKTLPGGLKVPIVFNTSGYPAGALAGGNFYWVSPGVASNENDTKGHNVFSGNEDNNLTEAPGRSIGCTGSNSCHTNIYGTTGPPYFGFSTSRQGCTKCHMIGSAGPQGYHHLDDTGTVVDSAAEGWFRFLDGHQGGTGAGVTGIEDDDWQQNPSASVHNEYLGFSASKTSAGGFSIGNIMTGYCTGCHGNFHIEQEGSVWVRHPSDAVIPNSGEFAGAFNAAGGIGAYDPLVPVARPSLDGWTAPDSTVRLGTDLVMCLSCHRAHGSPYFKMLRWDYRGWPGNGQTNGCNLCHTGKK